MYIYVLLQKSLISVFNIRERDFHVFEELQKRNNTHIYTYYWESPPHGGTQKWQNQHFSTSKSVYFLKKLRTWGSEINNMYIYNVSCIFQFPGNHDFAKFTYASVRFLFSRNGRKSIWSEYSNVSCNSPLHGEHAKV